MAALTSHRIAEHAVLPAGSQLELAQLDWPSWIG